MEKVIFFGNGPLAEYALAVFEAECQVIFHARTAEDLAQACELKREFPEAHGVLASYGVIISDDVLELFEPEGILNIHPSLLPEYRGPSPVESAILNGDKDFGVSVMKLVREMDAGPIYWQCKSNIVTDLFIYQEDLFFSSMKIDDVTDMILDKNLIYLTLAQLGAIWISRCFEYNDLPEPEPQSDEGVTYTRKFVKKDGLLDPSTDTAEMTLRKIVAFQGFPKPKYAFFGVNCTILEAHVLMVGETAELVLECADGRAVAIDRLQPEGRKAMDAKSFINGYKKL